VNNDPVNWVDLWGLECPKASDAAYRQQEVLGIHWYAETDKNNKYTGTYAGMWRATDPDGYVSVGTFSGSQLDFDKIPNTTGIQQSIVGMESVENARVVDIIHGDVGTNIVIAQDDRPSRDYSTSSDWYKQDGTPNYPDNMGFANGPSTETLPAGAQIDRYGYDSGSFVAPIGTPYNARSLPPESNGPYAAYTVLQDIEVQAGTTVPAFGQPGGGTQYLLPSTVDSLLRQQILKEIP
jgi:hypothetical protein